MIHSEPTHTVVVASTPEGGRLYGRDFAIAAALALAFVVLLASLHPLTGRPMDDDFSYARTAQAFARTGRVAYNGWGSPMMLPQAVYGGLLIRLFGFSYTMLQVSGIVVSALAVALLYLLARACGCRRGWALLPALTLALNPVTIMNAPSFMTDMPSLALLLLALLLMAVSIQGRSTASLTLRCPLFFASVAAGIIAGSNRQICWVACLGATAVFFLAAPTPRLRVPMLAGLALTVTAATVASAWFSAQDFIVPVNVTLGWQWFRMWPERVVWNMFRFLNLLGLFAIPFVVLALPSLWRARSPRRIVALLLLTVLNVVPLFVYFNAPDYGWPVIHLGIPQCGNYFTSTGPFVDGVPGAPDRTDVMPWAAAGILYIIGSISVAVIALTVADAMRQVRAALLAWLRFGEHVDAGMHRRDILAAALLASAVIQIAVSLPWYAEGAIFDRYLLLILPGVLVPLTLRIQESFPDFLGQMRRSALALGVVAGGAIAALTVIGIVFAVSYFDECRAVRRVYEELLQTGVARKYIDAGFELNGDTQILLTSFVNNPAVCNVPYPFPEGATSKYLTMFRDSLPSLDAYYRISTQPRILGRNANTFWPPIAAYSYSSLLPPYRRILYICRIVRDDNRKRIPTSSLTESARSIPYSGYSERNIR